MTRINTNATARTAAPAPRKAAVCLIRSTAARLVVERGHLGITNRLLQHEAKATSNHVGSVLCLMTHQGNLHGAKVVGIEKHWFANAELAQRWLSTTSPKTVPTPSPQQFPLRRAGLPAPVRLAAHASRADNPVITPPHVKPQHCPSPTHDDRYQCAPGARPAGAGFANAGIGRDVTTGKHWGAEA